MVAAALTFEEIRQEFAGPERSAPTLVLDGIDFAVDQGQFIAVIGPSGCGKSTLLQMAAGLLKPTRGESGTAVAP